MATPAPACRAALDQATKRWPKRNRASDGIMGDAAHRATKSDHNEGNAFDLTHDPIHGCDCAIISRQIISDRRSTYVIFNKRIWSRARAKEGWRAYTGNSPHITHMHVSIVPALRNNTGPWRGIASSTGKPAMLLRDFYPRKRGSYLSRPSMGRLRKGVVVNVISVVGAWKLTEHSGRRGWIPTKMLH